MARTVFTNISIYDGTGKRPYRGEVSIQGNRIEKVARNGQKLSRRGAAVVDGDGATLMPGLVNAHCHMSYTGPESMSEIPPEEHTLITMHNARTIIDHGVTAAVGAGAAKTRLDIVIRNEIDAGRIPGPRYRACSPEITVTGGLGDQRMLHYYKNDLSLFADGPEEIRQACRMLVREGVDIIKLMPSGDHLIPGSCDATQSAMDEDEIAAGAKVAHQRGRRLAAHARNPESIRLCVKYGIELIYHATYADEESLDLLEEHKDKHWVVPAIGFTHATAYEAGEFGITPAEAESWGFVRELEIGAQTLKKMHARGHQGAALRRLRLPLDAPRPDGAGLRALHQLPRHEALRDPACRDPLRRPGLRCAGRAGPDQARLSRRPAADRRQSAGRPDALPG